MHELYTTVSISSDGTIECRFGGKWCKFTKFDIIDAFGFYASEGEKEGGRPDGNGVYNDPDEEYDEKKFWDGIKCKDIRETQGFPLTAVQVNVVYLAYRYLAKSVFGKEGIAKIPKDDIYLLWKILQWRSRDLEDYPELRGFRPINLYPYILATIKNTTYIKVAKSSKLSLGAMITVFALRKGWTPGVNDKKIEPRMLPLGDRLFRTPLHPEGKPVPITLLRDRNDDEDADLKRKAPNVPPAPMLLETVPQPDRPQPNRSPPQLDRPSPPPYRSPLQANRPSPNRSPSHPIRSSPIDQPESPALPAFPAPLVFEAPPARRARARKDRSRPGKQVPPSPPHVARVSFDGPTRKEFEAMKSDMRANHRAMMEGQAVIHRYIEEDRSWKKENRELMNLLLDRNGFVEDLHFDEEAMERAHAERVARDHIPREP
ncbi:hypothetical protein CASFOL_000510 [Castilleja foliolosa]|uniref:Uncharacterized protein n=1 Tax=Castilleja foliolosa TaxID=1961234 RepID=A0ABD3EPG3_9LAMI